MEKITSFRFEIGSYIGSLKYIAYSKNKVSYRNGLPFFNLEANPPTIDRKVDEKEIETLARLLPLIMQWDKYSCGPDVCDGVVWSLKIQCGRKRIVRAGNDIFPIGYEEMQSALEQIIGMELFPEEGYDEEEYDVD